MQIIKEKYEIKSKIQDKIVKEKCDLRVDFYNGIIKDLQLKI